MPTRHPLLLTLLLASIHAAYAQTAPDAGALLQQIERNRSPALPKKSPPELLPAPPAMQEAPGLSVTVQQFRFQGNTLLSEVALGQVVAPYLGRQLSFQDLQGAALAVAGAYRRAGWIVRAYLPRQEIEGGTVTIQIVEAVFGGVRNAPGQAPVVRVPFARIEPYVTQAQPVGAALNADALDRALLIIDDLPGVSASGNLAAGQQENETDLLIRLEDEPVASGDAALDNTGNRSTGVTRSSVNLSLNSPLLLGDQLIANLIHTDGSDYGRLAYSLPVGSSGWRAGASASHLSYRLTADEFAALHANGSSNTVGLDASYPLLRSRLQNLYLQLNVDDKRFDNQANRATSSNYRIRGFSAGLSGNLFDSLGGGGANAASITVQRGKLDLDGSPSQAADAVTTRAAGNFTKLRYFLSRQQALTETFSLYGALSGQQASKNLDSSEKFYLGGNYGVRAYPASEAGGSDGQLLNLELRWRLPAGFGLTGFYDWGHVKVNHDNAINGAAIVNSYKLKGAGLAVNWVSDFRLNLRAAWARRIGSNPNPNINGSDQDGTLRKNRFWLQASLPF